MRAPEDATLRDAISRGDPRESLVTIRNHLAERLASVERADAVAPIANQLINVIEKLEKLPDAERESAVDDLSQRRTARRAAASGS